MGDGDEGRIFTLRRNGNLYIWKLSHTRECRPLNNFIIIESDKLLLLWHFPAVVTRRGARAAKKCNSLETAKASDCYQLNIIALFTFAQSPYIMSSLVIFYHTYVRWRIIICFVVASSQASLMTHFSFLAAKSISHSYWFCLPASGFLLVVHSRCSRTRSKAPFLRSAHSRPRLFFLPRAKSVVGLS